MSLHPIKCCCWDNGWPFPTLEVSIADDFGLIAKETGYAGSNLFIEDSWPSGPDSEFFYEDQFGPDRNGVSAFGSSGGPSCQNYEYEHINKFSDEAEEYEKPKDPCWDWKELSINWDYTDIVCPSSDFNPAIQIPDPNDPNETIPDPARIDECGNWDSRSVTRTVICSPLSDTDSTPPNPVLCPPVFYNTIPPNGENWCGGTIDDIYAPNITREFKKVFFDDGKFLRNEEELAFKDYFGVGGLFPTPTFVNFSRSKRDHRRSSRKAKLRVRFMAPPTCYFKVWTRVKIITRNVGPDQDEEEFTAPDVNCSPVIQISEEIYDLAPVEWIGTNENCKDASGYPFNGDTQVIDILNTLGEGGGNEFAFFEEGDLGKYQPPKEILGVTAGHRKSMSFTFKYSMLPNYEPEWGCMTTYIDEIGDVCRIFDPFTEEQTQQSCLNTNGLPTPICHNV
jgi:hypothetical protein